MPPTVTWETVFELYRDGRRIGTMHDFWQSASPITKDTQERFWKRVYDGYTVGSFSCQEYTGEDPNPHAYRSLEVGTF